MKFGDIRTSCYFGCIIRFCHAAKLTYCKNKIQMLFMNIYEYIIQNVWTIIIYIFE